MKNPEHVAFGILLRLYKGIHEPIRNSQLIRFKDLSLGRILLSHTILSKDFDGSEDDLDLKIKLCFDKFPETRSFVEHYSEDTAQPRLEFCLLLLIEASGTA